jgi:hypothetical protein
MNGETTMKARYLLIAALTLVPLVANAGETRKCDKTSASCPKGAECKKDKKECAKATCAHKDGEAKTCERTKQ